MTKRIQIPVSEEEQQLWKNSARKSGLTLAEWARRSLRERAAQELRANANATRSALKSLFELEAPVDEVQTMIEESVKGRY